jgi:hypothetical protein
MSNSIAFDIVNLYGHNAQTKTPEREKRSITVTNKIQDKLAFLYDNNDAKSGDKKDNLKEVINDDLFKILGYLKSQERLA